MNLYLVRHGDAEHDGDDSLRPLSARGREEVERLGAYLAARGVRVAEIRHSPKLRAAQTAEILSSALNAPRAQREGLMPNDDPRPLAADVGQATGDLMLVGHLPQLPLLAAVLLGATSHPIQLPTSGLARLRRTGDRWELL